MTRPRWQISLRTSLSTSEGTHECGPAVPSCRPLRRGSRMPVLPSRRSHWPIVVLPRRAAVHLAIMVAAVVAPAAAQTARGLPASRADTGTLAFVPGDSAAVRGRLRNGLRFVVRENHVPRHRAELRLVVNAGSVLEDEDQRGLAHFVEHMAFNGTAHFPKAALVDYLESVGVRFGADLNAETANR